MATPQTSSTSTMIFITKFEHHWTISNFSCLLSDNSPSFLFSSSFPPKNDDFQFSLRLQPKHVDENGDLHVSVFVHLQQSKVERLETTYRLSLFNIEEIPTEFNVNEKTDDFSKEICFGFSNFITHEKLQKLLPLFGDNLMIQCQVTIKSSKLFIIETPLSWSTFKASENVIKFTHKWIVDDFSTFYYENMHKSKASLKLDYASPPENGDFKFYPVLYMINEEKVPELEPEKTYISLYIYFESEFVKEIMASFRLSILDWKNNLYVTGEGHEKFISKGDGKGPKYFIMCDELMDMRKGLLPKDQLTIFGRIEVFELQINNESGTIEETAIIEPNSENDELNQLVLSLKVEQDLVKLKLSIMKLENFLLKQKQLNSLANGQLVEALNSHTAYLSQVNITSDYEHMDMGRYQVGWCAKWTIDNVLENAREWKRKQIPLLKFSQDRCEVRNDTEGNISVCSSFAVTSGVYYYEAIPLTEGKMRFGWSTKEVKLSKLKKIGDDEYSIGLEVMGTYQIYHKGIHSISNMSSQRSINVIGCLLDTDNRKFVFYLNGEEIEFLEMVYFSSLSYYASASLSSTDHCYFNFGQAPFKCPPKNIEFNYFHQINENVESYQLAETSIYKEYFWFAHPVIDNQIALFYRDPKQVECDQLVIQLEHNEHNQTTQLDHSVECGRLVQSVIEVLDRRLTCDHTDLVTRWIREMIGETRDSDFKVAKLFELLYPYHQNSVTSQTICFIKRHNICLIMLMLYFRIITPYSLTYNYDIMISTTIQTFFSFKQFLTNPSTFIYALNCLESRRLPYTTQALLTDPSIMTTLNWCYELFGQVSSVSQLYEPSYDLVRLKAGMFARWFREHVMGDGEENFPSQSALNPKDKSEHIKLSSDCLSARNDYWDWQSVRSVCSASSGTFYYEAVLLTDGMMKIGWATEHAELHMNGIGWEEDSIGFDGSDGHRIYHKDDDDEHNNKDASSSKIRNFSIKPKPQWSIGDVIGCSIHFKKKRFKFFLNGKLIKSNKSKIKSNIKEVKFFDKPYYAAVSLFQHQQCYLNLGQCSFKYPPNFRFKTFASFDLSHKVYTTPSYYKHEKYKPVDRFCASNSLSLFHSPLLSECYSLVQVLTKDRVELVFDDDKQEKSDQLVEKNVYNESILANLKTEIHRLRLLQSLISVSGSKLLDTCVSVQANFIAHLITQSTSVNPAFLDLVAQLLYPYFALHLTNDTVSTHRNVCIVLASMIIVIDNLKSRINLYHQFLTYLTEIVINTNHVEDDWLLMFALIGLENMNMTERDIETIKANKKFCKTLVTQDDSNISNQALCARWFSDKVLNLIQETDPINKQATMNPLNKTSHLKLSPDLLTVRSDHQWQSILSICSTDKVAYYEVTLHTSGPMRIGFGNKKFNLNQDPIGTDDNSIGYDGFNQCIWYNNQRIKLIKNKVPRWKLGDIVGCLIDVNKHSFSFYLNCQLICIHTLGHSSRGNYYFVAVSLHSFQQCRLNFGPPELPPDRMPTGFNTFNSILDLTRSSFNSLLPVGTLMSQMLDEGVELLNFKHL